MSDKTKSSVECEQKLLVLLVALLTPGPQSLLPKAGLYVGCSLSLDV